jgi:hypothetical protein
MINKSVGVLFKVISVYAAYETLVIHIIDHLISGISEFSERIDDNTKQDID